MTRPKVWLVPYLRGWSYDITARALHRHLSHRFEFRIAYQATVDAGGLEDWSADLIVDFWWHAALPRRYGRRVIKQISSHRWAQRKWGCLKPTNVVKQFCAEAGAIVVPSRRLHRMFTELDHDTAHMIEVAPKGFNPDLFSYQAERRGELTIGWAGAAEAKDKNVDVLLEVEPRTRLADQCLTQGEMSDFYNGLDVITIASDAEGDPRPLIEGMACGCFPVSTDVGIVPELVTDGVNGLILPDRLPATFRRAYEWCRDNIAHVREQGRRNALAMRNTRTWAHVAPAWGRVLDNVINAQRACASGEMLFLG